MFWRNSANNEDRYQAKKAVRATLEERRIPHTVRLYFDGQDIARLEKAARLARCGQVDAAQRLVQSVVQ